MKKVRNFIAIGLAALSMTLFAQNNIDGIHSVQPLANSYKLIAKNHNPVAHAPRPSSRIIAEYDSIYTWNWDTNTFNWNKQAYSKYINITYDANANMLTELYQK